MNISRVDRQVPRLRIFVERLSTLPDFASSALAGSRTRTVRHETFLCGYNTNSYRTARALYGRPDRLCWLAFASRCREQKSTRNGGWSEPSVEGPAIYSHSNSRVNSKTSDQKVGGSNPSRHGITPAHCALARRIDAPTTRQDQGCQGGALLRPAGTTIDFLKR
jgi:hypothetical protein